MEYITSPELLEMDDIYNAIIHKRPNLQYREIISIKLWKLYIHFWVEYQIISINDH